MSKTIIVSRYDETLEWLDGFDNDFKIILYNKGSEIDTKYKQLENIGREGFVYLTHIIENYDSLDEHNFFLQGDAIAHCGDNIHDIINNFDFDFNNYKSVSFQILPDVIGLTTFPHLTEVGTGELTTHFLFEQILKKDPEKVKNIKYTPYCCACFYVNKNNILRHSLETYKTLRNKIEKHGIHYEWVLEASWHVLFDNCYYTQ